MTEKHKTLFLGGPKDGEWIAVDPRETYISIPVEEHPRYRPVLYENKMSFLGSTLTERNLSSLPSLQQVINGVSTCEYQRHKLYVHFCNIYINVFVKVGEDPNQYLDRIIPLLKEKEETEETEETRARHRKQKAVEVYLAIKELCDPDNPEAFHQDDSAEWDRYLEAVENLEKK